MIQTRNSQNNGKAFKKFCDQYICNIMNFCIPRLKGQKRGKHVNKTYISKLFGNLKDEKKNEEKPS